MAQTNPTSAPKTFSDLYYDLINRTSEQSIDAPTIEQAKRYIQVGLLDMHIGQGEKFPWAEASAFLKTHAPYSTGTLSVSGSILTGVGTAWNSLASNNLYNNMRAGGKIRIGGSQDVYPILTVADDTTAALATPFKDGTAAAGTTYQYFEDEYDLSTDFLRPLDQQQFSDGISIDLIGRNEFRRRYPRNSILGTPSVATINDAPLITSLGPTRRIRFHQVPDAVYLIPYSFVRKDLVVNSSGQSQTEFLADDDEPIVPHHLRMLIVLHALANWYRDRKDDARSDKVRAEYASLLSRTVNDTEIGSRNPQIRPRVGTYRRSARRPYRGGGRGRFDINGRFDRLEW